MTYNVLDELPKCTNSRKPCHIHIINYDVQHYNGCKQGCSMGGGGGRYYVSSKGNALDACVVHLVYGLGTPALTERQEGDSWVWRICKVKRKEKEDGSN